MSRKCEPENAEVFSCPTCGNEYDSHDAPAICETLRSSISDAQAVKAQAARIRDLVSDNEKLGRELVDYQTRAADLRAKLNALREETNRQDAVIVELRTMLKTVEAQRQHYAKVANEVTAQLRSVEAQLDPLRTAEQTIEDLRTTCRRAYYELEAHVNGRNPSTITLRGVILMELKEAAKI